LNSSRKALIERIIELIKTNEIVTEGKLPSERDLAVQLGVSRTMLREALISLETLGVIEMRGKEGIALINATSEDIKQIVRRTNAWPFEEISEIMQIRLLVEPNVVAFAAANRTDEDIKKLKHCLEELFRADAEKKAEEAAYWNTVLHAAILKIANNNILFSFYQHIFQRMQESCRMLRIEIMGNTPEFTKIILQQHFDMVEAIISQDQEKGRQVCKDHILHTISGLRQSSQIIAFSRFLSN
jgi:GntR family transcriptional repressor for pyruvate dehydrogenase complex